MKFVSILKKSTLWTKTWIPISQSRALDRAGGPSQSSLFPTGTVTSAVSLNSNNPAVALPTEILHAIFLWSVRVYGLRVELFGTTASHLYPPCWISITQVCQRWRYVALGLKELWTTITLDLSPKWIIAFLQRSSYAPTQICIDVAPWSPLKKPLEIRPDAKRRPARQPLMKPPSITVDEVLSHTLYIKSLHLCGKATDVIQALMSIDRRGPLTSLSIHLSGGLMNFSRYDYGNRREETPLVLPNTFLGGGAPQLRSLHSHYGLHVIFPSWVLGALSEFTVSHSFSATRLFTALRQMPQLEVLTIRPARQYFFLSSTHEVIDPIHLNNLNLLVFVDSCLELLIPFLSCLSAPASVRRHLKLTLDGYRFDHRLWRRFSSLMCATIAAVPNPPHGIHFRHELHGTRVRIWGTPSEQGLPPSPWPPLDDLYSLEIRYPGPSYRMPWNPVADYNSSSFRYLQQFCAPLGGSSVQELLIDCEMGLNITIVPEVPQLCWRALFSGFPSLRTLRFGVGATELLAGASKAISLNEKDPHAGVLPSSLQRVIVDRCEFSTRTLWKWIHYATALPSGADYSDLREDVLALLSERLQKSADANPVEDATKALLIFLLRCGSRDDSALKFALVECKWDDPDGLEILRLLLRSFDLDYDAILETTSSD
ncbi:hypothetical protein EDB89DRAFT_2072046 [Lactarius sanguifluus]|nr:hypothetical protein EDB89DRAFT_2072046 [Lactarius sanguifluus]